MRAESLIGKCIEGRTAKDVIRSIEEEAPDVSRVRSQLIRDFRNAQVILDPRSVVAESTCIKIVSTVGLDEDSRSILMNICDVYSRTYPEVEVLIAAHTKKP